VKLTGETFNFVANPCVSAFISTIPMSKTKSDIDIRLRVLELAADIAGEAAQNTNIVWMIEFQEELVERLYRRMMTLLEESTSDEDEDDGMDDVKERGSKRKRR
jgi:hypothetical protein